MIVWKIFSVNFKTSEALISYQQPDYRIACSNIYTNTRSLFVKIVKNIDSPERVHHTLS